MLQLVANCHIPAAFGGLEGEALFIDTEGSFSVRRLEEIAAGLGEGLGVTPKSVLAGTHVIHAVGWAELAAVIYALPRLLDAHPKVRLVAIDSITFPIHSMDTANGSSCRTRVVAALMQSLCTVASERGLVVVITNHLTTRIDGQSSLLAPSLGDGFGHSSTFRLRLFWSQDTRYVAVDKAPVVTSSASGPCTPIPFTIVQCGIRPAKSLK